MDERGRVDAVDVELGNVGDVRVGELSCLAERPSTLPFGEAPIYSDAGSQTLSHLCLRLVMEERGVTFVRVRCWLMR